MNWKRALGESCPRRQETQGVNPIGPCGIRASKSDKTAQELQSVREVRWSGRTRGYFRFFCSARREARVLHVRNAEVVASKGVLRDSVSTVGDR